MRCSHPGFVLLTEGAVLVRLIAAMSGRFAYLLATIDLLDAADALRHWRALVSSF